MKTRYTFFILCILVFTASCSTISVHYDYDTGADFTRLKTYDWLPIPITVRANELTVKRAIEAVNRQLKAKGLRMTSVNPDFLIALHGGKQTKLDITDWGYSYGRHGRFRGGPIIDVYEYEEGTLILDFVDAQSKELIWRGKAQGEIDSHPTPEKQRKRINEAVSKILENFPPPSSSSTGY